MPSRLSARPYGYLLVAMVASMASCYIVNFEDVSNLSEFSPLVGQKFVAIQDAKIYGITLDADYARRVDQFKILPSPGTGGPEVLSEDVIAGGTIIQVLKVLRCTDCILDFEPRIELAVNVDRFRAPENIEIRVNLDHVLGASPLFVPIDRRP